MGSLLAATVGLALAGLSGWVTAAEYPGPIPAGDYEPRRFEAWTYGGPEGEARRRDTLSRAALSLSPADAAAFQHPVLGPLPDDLSNPVPACRFVGTRPSGTSAKFDCVFDGGALVKVKYGRNPEIHGEAAATRLLRMLGYPADTITLVPRLRCYGCPRFPFLAMHLRSALAFPLIPLDGHDTGYTDFEWVAVERRFPAHPIESDTQQGWSWWELKDSRAPRADVDALRLTAMFLAHWDNKSENQRLVCLDGPPRPNATCARPLAIVQDLGATFGPSKINLARWRTLPVWHDRAACVVSMRALPYGGASFTDVQISEAGRAQLAQRLIVITDLDVERLFAEARFPQFQSGTDDDSDLKAWTAAFRHRADQIVNSGPCPL